MGDSRCVRVIDACVTILLSIACSLMSCHMASIEKALNLNTSLTDTIVSTVVRRVFSSAASMVCRCGFTF